MQPQLTNQQVALFRSLFRGRETSHGTYDPQSESHLTIKLSITDETVRAHLVGERPLGIFLLDENNYVNFTVIDIDKQDLSLVQRCIDQLASLGLKNCYIERSKRKGYHIWIFLAEPLPAAWVRAVINGLLKEIGVTTEVFPKQDILNERAGYGNFINLPLFGKHVENDKTVFIDPKNDWQPFSDQWLFLDQVERIPSECIEFIMDTKGWGVETDKPEEPRTFTLATPSKGSSRPLPPCAQKALSEGVDDGMRDAWAFQLAKHLRRLGTSRESISAQLNEWDKKLKPPLGEKIIEKKIDQAFKGYTSFGCDNPLIKGLCGGACVFDKSPTSLSIANQELATCLLPSPLSISLSELLKKEIKIEWLAENILQVGVFGFIAGEPKTTKSWLALHIGLCIATGTPVLGKYTVSEAKRVLYVQEEDPEVLVKERASWFIRGGIPEPADGFFQCVIRAGIQIDNPQHLDALLKEMDANKYALVIFDVLAKLHTKDENAQAEMAVLLGSFESIKRKYLCTILVVHHFRKTTPGSSFRGNQRIRGSSVLAGASENSFYITFSSGLQRVEFESKAIATDPFFYALETEKYDDGKTFSAKLVLVDSPKDHGKEEKLEQVRQAVANSAQSGDRQSSTKKALAKIVGMSEKTTGVYLKILIEDKEIKVEKYRSPDGRGHPSNVYLPSDTLDETELME